MGEGGQSPATGVGGTHSPKNWFRVRRWPSLSFRRARAHAKTKSPKPSKVPMRPGDPASSSQPPTKVRVVGIGPAVRGAEPGILTEGNALRPRARTARWTQTRALVGLAVAVVVLAIADLGRIWMNRGIRVVAVVSSALVRGVPVAIGVDARAGEGASTGATVAGVALQLPALPAMASIERDAVGATPGGRFNTTRPGASSAAIVGLDFARYPWSRATIAAEHRECARAGKARGLDSDEPTHSAARSDSVDGKGRRGAVGADGTVDNDYGGAEHNHASATSAVRDRYGRRVGGAARATQGKRVRLPGGRRRVGSAPIRGGNRSAGTGVGLEETRPAYEREPSTTAGKTGVGSELSPGVGTAREPVCSIDPRVAGAVGLDGPAALHVIVFAD